VRQTTLGYGKRIEGLCLLARPYVRAFDGDEGFKLVVDNVVHHNVIEDGADGCPHHLHGECYAWGKMAVLG
jgi:hypothetical protein